MYVFFAYKQYIYNNTHILYIYIYICMYPPKQCMYWDILRMGQWYIMIYPRIIRWRFDTEIWIWEVPNSTSITGNPSDLCRPFLTSLSMGMGIIPPGIAWIAWNCKTGSHRSINSRLLPQWLDTLKLWPEIGPVQRMKLHLDKFGPVTCPHRNCSIPEKNTKVKSCQL